MQPHRRLCFEPLESRQMLAVDLTVVDVQFVDPTDIFGATVGTLPVEGQKLALRAEINFSDLTVNDSYTLRFDVDGVAIDVENIVGTPGQNITHFWVRDGWVARPDSLHTVTVTIDAANAIAEANEANNEFSFQFTPDAPTSLPQKFINPLAGTENVDWIVNGYVDVNPAFCFECAEDFRGNSTLTRDFHNGIDFGLINFAQADRGVDVRAAAAGTVILAQDGYFDRWSSFQFPVPEGNRVFIDHGNGWVTQYYHLQNDSVSVSNGAQVTAGQVIGRVGSSGNSAGPHLHFEVQRNHAPVEPFVSPTDYFVDPAAYAYDVDPVLHDLGITTAFPYFRDIIEQPSDNDALPAQSVSLFPWVVLSSIEPGDTWQLKVFRPNGSEYAQPAFAVPIEFAADISGSWQWNRWWNLFLENPEAGNWQAEVFVNGTSVGHETFVVGRSLPELRVIEDANTNGTVEFDEPLIIDSRRTPLDFGATAQGATASTKTFIVENHGFADLTISAVQLPAGYSLTEPLSTTIPPGDSDSFTVVLDTTAVGNWTGQIALLSNDRVAADVDADGDVDGANFLAWQRGFGKATPTVAQGDANGNGAVGADDLLLWQQQFGAATETRFEFNLAGEVTAPLIATSAASFPALDVTKLGKPAQHPDNSVLWKPTLITPIVGNPRAIDHYFATLPRNSKVDPIATRNETREDSRDDWWDGFYFFPDQVSPTWA